jgi:hypothetical protein
VSSCWGPSGQNVPLTEAARRSAGTGNGASQLVRFNCCV